MSLIIIAGKSGSGKDALVNELVRRGYDRITTYTTRPKRKGEYEGHPYHFVSEKDFLNKKDKGFFLETKEYKVASGESWYYGSPKNELLSLRNNNENRLIILTPSGVDDFIKINKTEHVDNYIIYLRANSGTIRKRLKRRGDNPEEIERRIEADDNDFVAFEYFCNKEVWNNSGTELIELADEVEEIIKEIKDLNEW